MGSQNTCIQTHNRPEQETVFKTNKVAIWFVYMVQWMAVKYKAFPFHVANFFSPPNRYPLRVLKCAICQHVCNCCCVWVFITKVFSSEWEKRIVLCYCPRLVYSCSHSLFKQIYRPNCLNAWLFYRLWPKHGGGSNQISQYRRWFVIRYLIIVSLEFCWRVFGVFVIVVFVYYFSWRPEKIALTKPVCCVLLGQSAEWMTR